MTHTNKKKPIGNGRIIAKNYLHSNLPAILISYQAGQSITALAAEHGIPRNALAEALGERRRNRLSQFKEALPLGKAWLMEDWVHEYRQLNVLVKAGRITREYAKPCFDYLAETLNDRIGRTGETAIDLFKQAGLI
jgi:hypothetical protein